MFNVRRLLDSTSLIETRSVNMMSRRMNDDLNIDIIVIVCMFSTMSDIPDWLRDASLSLSLSLSLSHKN